jgi:hypothetical protein
MMMMLTIFLIASCQTTVENNVTPVSFPVPLPPEKPSVEFQNIREMEEPPEEGLYLSYEDGRRLAVYLNDMKAYKKKVEAVFEYYEVQELPTQEE